MPIGLSGSPIIGITFFRLRFSEAETRCFGGVYYFFALW